MAREEEKRAPAVGIRAGNSASASATTEPTPGRHSQRSFTREEIGEKKFRACGGPWRFWAGQQEEI
jgi:hypothetical protein